MRLSVAALVGWLAWLGVPGAMADELGAGDDIVTAAPEPAVPAAQRPLELRADSLEYERARDLYVARGGVVVRQGQRELAADWMAFSNETRQAVASGGNALGRPLPLSAVASLAGGRGSGPGQPGSRPGPATIRARAAR